MPYGHYSSVYTSAGLSFLSALPCFLVGYYRHAETLRVIQVLSGVEHELLIQTESGAVTDPVAVERRRKKKKRSPPLASAIPFFLPLSLSLSIHLLSCKAIRKRDLARAKRSHPFPSTRVCIYHCVVFGKR